MPVEQAHDPYATDTFSGNSSWSPEFGPSGAAIAMNMPNDDFRNSAQNVGEGINFCPQPTIGFPANPACCSYSNTGNSWLSNPAWVEAQWQGGHHIFPASASISNYFIPSEQMADPQFPHEVINPRLEGILMYHGETGKRRSELGLPHEVTTAPYIRNQEMWHNNQQQDNNDWALPICRTPYPFIGLNRYEGPYP